MKENITYFLQSVGIYRANSHHKFFSRSRAYKQPEVHNNINLYCCYLDLNPQLREFQITSV